ncbi:MAG TPA: DNA repair protein RadA [Acidimicrobiia bacterium]|nr:DNA repair protein RadA [Acidimicrobiia bacterium]
MRTRTGHRCTACAAEVPRWLGRCPDCGAWGSFVEAVPHQDARPVDGPTPITEVATTAGARRRTGLAELDRVLGGGLVPGSVTLLAGEPGMGKSTLLLQALGRMARAGARCLLVGAEESPEQVRLRAERVDALHPELRLVADPSLPTILAVVAQHRPDVLAVDSIQTIVDPDRTGAPGSVTQVRECAHALVQLAKREARSTLLVGHVTKDGAVAGPRALEHVVDTVLSVDGHDHHTLRLVRALKHRFGSTQELGVLEMRDTGLVEVPDPSSLFLEDRRADAPGSAVAAVLDGARPLLVEVQALVAPAVGPPRRVADGFDSSRLTLLLAVLEARGAETFRAADVYANVVGGVRVTEPGLDLAVALAVAGAQLDRALAADSVVVGEIGLGGEIRQVAGAGRRLAEAARLGFRQVIGPASLPATPGLTARSVATVHDALRVAFGDGDRPAP